MALPATENFTGTGALSGNWTNQQNTCSRVADQGAGDFVDYCSALWTADAFNNDQYAQAVAAVLVAASYSTVLVRGSGSNNWYEQFWDGTDNDLVKNVGGSITTIGANIIPTVSVNDVIRLEVQGTTLRVYKNGVQQGSDVTDASLSSGSAGFGSFDNKTRVDNWEGGNLVMGVPFFTQLDAQVI